MNVALSEEQEFLQEAARNALGRVKTVEAARDALEGEALPDLWPTAVEAGWPGLLVSEANDGAGLGALEAMLVLAELGRVLAAVPLLGHLPATLLLDRAGADAQLLRGLAAGSTRAAIVPARPPAGAGEGWTVDGHVGSRVAAPVLDAEGQVSGEVAWVPDAPGADVLVVVATGDDGAPVAVVLDASAEGVAVEPVVRYDATRSLGHVRLSGAAGTVLDPGADELARAWLVGQTLLGAESLGAAQAALDSAVAYAKERFTFGRAIGSYQAVKHSLVEILRRTDNATSLMYFAGWAAADEPSELPTAASAFRYVAGEALEDASRTLISVHGGIGATFEHDAPLWFRKAQLSRRLLGGTAGAADAVAGELFAAARASAAA